MCLSCDSFIVGAHKVAAIVNIDDVVIAFSPQLIDSLKALIQHCSVQ